ncbi:hypothetical protein BJ508DRAFT_367920 [Ascobolus immersus RN42]|uniref:RING-type domain-containing protein n=1 Tax=Ascobolus immersus RN42 TaxID=1160509 RepID=A0A3N4H8A5_ASCIM|nr:hypothetical protein BJ508DRAFT_367920 [Ascobolus immersus RN42]
MPMNRAPNHQPVSNTLTFFSTSTLLLLHKPYFPKKPISAVIEMGFPEQDNKAPGNVHPNDPHPEFWKTYSGETVLTPPAESGQGIDQVDGAAFAAMHPHEPEQSQAYPVPGHPYIVLKEDPQGGLVIQEVEMTEPADYPPSPEPVPHNNEDLDIIEETQEVVPQTEKVAVDLALEASKAARKIELELEAQEEAELAKALAESTQTNKTDLEAQEEAELARALADSKLSNTAQEDADLEAALAESRAGLAAAEAREKEDIEKALAESRAGLADAEAKERDEIAKALAESKAEWEAGALSDKDYDNMLVDINLRAHTSKVEEAELMKAIEASYRSLNASGYDPDAEGAAGPSNARGGDEDAGGSSSSGLMGEGSSKADLEAKLEDLQGGKEEVDGEGDIVMAGALQPELPPCPPPTEQQTPEDGITPLLSSRPVIDNGLHSGTYIPTLGTLAPTGVAPGLFPQNPTEAPAQDLAFELAMNAIVEDADAEPISDKRKGKMKANPCQRCEEQSEVELKVCGHRFCMQCITDVRDRAEKTEKWASEGAGFVPCPVCEKGFPGRAIGAAVVRI